MVEEEPQRKRGRAGGGKRHAATASQQEGVRNLDFLLFLLLDLLLEPPSE